MKMSIKRVIAQNYFKGTKITGNHTLFRNCFFLECTCGLIQCCRFEGCIFEKMEVIVDHDCILSECRFIDATLRMGRPKPEPWSVS